MPSPARPFAALAIIAAVILASCAADDEPAIDDLEPPASEVEDDGANDDAAGDASDPDDGQDLDDVDTDAQSAPDTEPVLSVTATVAPIADLVRMVGGERVAVSTLVPAGADSHTYEPRPGDVARLSEVDAYFGVGLDLNPAALRLAEQNVPSGAPVVLLGEVALGDDALVFDHSHGDDDHGHSHGDDDHGHSHGDGVEPGPNPHVWTSVRNAAALVEAIADALGELDPDGEDVYREQAAAAQDELAALDERIVDATATIPDANRVLVTYHDAWTYFARDYRLEFVTAVQPVDFSEPSAAEVRDVIDLIRERGVVAIFGSEVFPTPVMDAIADETDATYYAELADDVLPGQPGEPEHTYVELMRRNAVTIVSGLGGDASALEE